jgi:transcriptional regulator with XRE-family HTH domain
MLEQEKKSLAGRMKLAIKQSGTLQKDIAQACKVTDQAVSGWLHTGKVDKSHLRTIAVLTGVNVGWLLTGDGDPHAHTKIADSGVSEMGPMAYTKSQRILDQLRALIEHRSLTDDDMILLGKVAKRMQREKKV